MNRDFYLNLARSGARFPIGTDLLLHEHADHAEILLDGQQLGKVIEETANRFHTSLAIHLMDLTLEKDWLIHRLGIAGDPATFHFAATPPDEALAKLSQPFTLSPRLRANVEAIRHIARNTNLVPCGMAIGPFSLTTKLLADPITPVYLAGTGSSAADDPEVAAVERLLQMSLRIVMDSIQLQADAGAKVMFIAEPAANKVYFSPKQLEAGADIFERYAMMPNREIKSLLDKRGLDLIFHCCGELIDPMVSAFASLDPVILSLGSSRKLWEDARLVPKTTVLYGNLPSKRFCSDELKVEDVEKLAQDLIGRMREANHPFILGSECDVLSVSGCEKSIRDKVKAFMSCSCH